MEPYARAFLFPPKGHPALDSTGALIDPLHDGVAAQSSIDSELVAGVAAKLGAAGLCPIDLHVLTAAAITNALEHSGGNRTHAARSLGISVRTLQRKIRDGAYGIVVAAVGSSQSFRPTDCRVDAAGRTAYPNGQRSGSSAVRAGDS